jgi:hypothetical protein
MTKYVAISSSWTSVVAQKHRFQAEASAIGGVSVYTWAMVEWSPRKQMSLKNFSVTTLTTVGVDTWVLTPCLFWLFSH